MNIAVTREQISDLVITIPPLTLSSRITDVANLFLSDHYRELLCLPVVEDDKVFRATPLCVFLCNLMGANCLGKEKPELAVNKASTLDEALTLLEQHPNAILLTDLILAEGDISEGLALLKLRRPQLVVIVVTAFTDTSHLISLINRAQVYRVLPMPLSRRMLLNSVDSALRHQELLNSRPALLRRHQVASPGSESKPASTIIHRVRGYLDRIRA